MVVESQGLPIEFELTGGEVSEYTIADKGYDSEELREIIRSKPSMPIIPRKNNSTIGNNDMDWGLYKYRHLVENVFARWLFMVTDVNTKQINFF